MKRYQFEKWIDKPHTGRECSQNVYWQKLVSMIYQELLQLSSKMTNSPIKTYDQHFIK